MPIMVYKIGMIHIIEGKADKYSKAKPTVRQSDVC